MLQTVPSFGSCCGLPATRAVRTRGGLRAEHRGSGARVPDGQGRLPDHPWEGRPPDEELPVAFFDLTGVFYHELWIRRRMNELHHLQAW